MIIFDAKGSQLPEVRQMGKSVKSVTIKKP